MARPADRPKSSDRGARRNCGFEDVVVRAGECASRRGQRIARGNRSDARSSTFWCRRSRETRRRTALAELRDFCRRSECPALDAPFSTKHPCPLPAGGHMPPSGNSPGVPDRLPGLLAAVLGLQRTRSRCAYGVLRLTTVFSQKSAHSGRFVLDQTRPIDTVTRNLVPFSTHFTTPKVLTPCRIGNGKKKTSRLNDRPHRDTSQRRQRSIPFRQRPCS